MKFSPPLTTSAKIIKRYKRFFADITNHHNIVETLYLPNTGSMKSCYEAGDEVAYSVSDNLKRKLPKTLEMIKRNQSWVGVNTQLTNHIVQEFIEEKKIPSLEHFSFIKREVKILDSKIDFLLQNQQTKKECYLEVKNVTMRDLRGTRRALFPDAVSIRALKHLRDLVLLRKDGYEAALLFLVQREDVDDFSPCQEIDPAYARELSLAQKQGLPIFVAQCYVSPEEITFWREIPFISSL